MSLTLLSIRWTKMLEGREVVVVVTVVIVSLKQKSVIITWRDDWEDRFIVPSSLKIIIVLRKYNVVTAFVEISRDKTWDEIYVYNNE